MNTIRLHIKHFISGILIGIANIIPGVSGGTMAVILGVYRKLMEAIGEFFTNKEKRMEYIFLIAKIGAGAIAGILLFAKLLEISLNQHPQPTHFFFMGLILGSLPILYTEIKGQKKTPFSIISFAAGAGLVILFAVLSPEPAQITGEPAFTSADYIVVLVSGFIASGAMVIPGISGAFMLILLGQYSRILKLVSSFSLKSSYLIPLGFFGIGVVLGILFFARLMDFLLKRFFQPTMTFIIGLVLGSLVKIWPGFSSSGIIPFLNIATFLAGFGAAIFLGRWNREKLS
jgi:putative membrane protein